MLISLKCMRTYSRDKYWSCFPHPQDSPIITFHLWWYGLSCPSTFTDTYWVADNHWINLIWQRDCMLVNRMGGLRKPWWTETVDSASTSLFFYCSCIDSCTWLAKISLDFHHRFMIKFSLELVNFLLHVFHPLLPFQLILLNKLVLRLMTRTNLDQGYDWLDFRLSQPAAILSEVDRLDLLPAIHWIVPFLCYQWFIQVLVTLIIEGQALSKISKMLYLCREHRHWIINQLLLEQVQDIDVLL
jgi:hypothetical protein